MPTSDADLAEMVREFKTDRPDLSGSIKLMNGELMIEVNAIPQFTLWAVGKGYGPPEAFGKSIEMRDAIKAHFGKK